MKYQSWAVYLVVLVVIVVFTHNHAAIASNSGSNPTSGVVSDSVFHYGDPLDANFGNTIRGNIGNASNNYSLLPMSGSIAKTSKSNVSFNSYGGSPLALINKLAVESPSLPITQAMVVTSAAILHSNAIAGKKNSWDAMVLKARLVMVTNQIVCAGREITQPDVIAAMSAVPREQFAPARLMKEAYMDKSIDIGDGRRMESPYTVATVANQLNSYKTDRVLELGTGSGYQTAVLSLLAKTVYTIESSEIFTERSTVNLRRLGYTNNIFFLQGDLNEGWLQAAPFDVIVVNGDLRNVSDQIKMQLKDGGRLVYQINEDGNSISLQKVGQSLQPLTSHFMRSVSLDNTNGCVQLNISNVPTLKFKSN